MPYRPSITERPVIRIRFKSPDGERHQATLSSSWHSGFSRLPIDLDQDHSGFTDLEHSKATISTHIYELFEGLGCTVQGIESVGINVQDF